jgi:hypothetical protein
VYEGKSSNFAIDRKGKVFDLKEEEMEEFYKNGCMFKDVSALTNYNVHKVIVLRVNTQRLSLNWQKLFIMIET